jgi:transposase
MSDQNPNTNPSAASQTVEPDPEVLPRPVRRQFSAHEKLAILDELASLSGTGQIGAYLREKGLYSSQVSAWRQAYDEGGIDALAPKTRGPKPLPHDELERRSLRDQLERLHQKNAALERKLAQANAIIDVQKKLAALMDLLPQS